MNSLNSLFWRAVRGPILLITVGILFAVHQAGALSISRSWPLLLIVAGVVILAERMATPQRTGPGTAPPYSAPPPSSSVPAGGPTPRRMFIRRSIAGPLLVIGVGVLFLLQTISPAFSVGRLIAFYWPYILIAWGVLQLVEASVYARRGLVAGTYGVSGGNWFLVVVICLVGSAAFEFHHSDHWWNRAGYRRSVAVFGSEHDYPISLVQKAVGSAPLVVIDGIRGDIKISGISGSNLQVSGHKTIRAMETADANRANEATPVQVLVHGDNVTVRCNALEGRDRLPMVASLDLQVPQGASVRVNGMGGDLTLSSLAGDVDLTGRGGDIELEKIAGKVTIRGHYEGMLSLREVAQPIHVENMGTHLDVQRAPGEIRIDRGTLSAQNVVGPVKLSTDATDVALREFSEGLELSVDRGDVSLRPLQLPLSKMNIHTRSGNIDLSLPPSSMFTIAANAERGDIENDFGGALTLRNAGHSAHLQGAVGNGPDIHLTTDRGTITVRKSDSSDKPGQKATRQEEPVPAGSEVAL
jgi:Putative adhesin